MASASSTGVKTFSGGYEIHTFTTSGTINFTTGGSIEILAIAGGGPGGVVNGYNAGGGGAGGLLYYGAETPKTPNGSAITVADGTQLTVTVGAGGAAIAYNSYQSYLTPSNGANTTIVGSGFTTLTAIGGGYGGAMTNIGSLGATGNSGGSGGGSGPTDATQAITPGAGTTGQGFQGGTVTGTNGYPGSGGGGASQTGQGQTGGAGLQYSITGVPTYYAGGGGGGGGGTSGWSAGSYGQGGLGGGGRGGSSSSGSPDAVAGTDNTGAGGGGGGVSKNGGSGIVVVRFVASAGANYNQLFQYFPDNYYNNLISSAPAVKYVSASGNNSNSGNSKDAPYLTVDFALSAVSAISTSVTIVVLPGTYNIAASASNSAPAYGTVGIKDGNKPRIFACVPGQVIFNMTDATGLRDFAPFDFQNTGSAIYGAIIQRNNGARTLSYATAFFNDETCSFKGKAYNCVFRETNANNTWALQYDNGNDSPAQIRNCVIYTGGNGSGDYSGSSTATIVDSVFNYTYGTTSMTLTNNVTAQTVNATTYVTTGQTTRGVYSGTYTWSGTATPPGPGLYTPSSATSGTSFTITLVTSGLTDGTTVPYTISGVTSAMINGASLTGNFTVTNNTATLTILPTLVMAGDPSPKAFAITADSTTVVLSIGYAITLSGTVVPLRFIDKDVFKVSDVAGQMSIPKNYTATQTASGSATQLLGTSAKVNSSIAGPNTITTAAGSRNGATVIKVFGDIPNRESWL